MGAHVDLWRSAAVVAHLEAQTWWREGDTSIEYAAWIEHADGTNWTADVTAWFASKDLVAQHFEAEKRRAEHQLTTDSEGVHCNLEHLFVVANDERSLAALKGAVEKDATLVYTRAMNVNTIKSYDGVPLYRVDRTMSKMMTMFYVAPLLKNAGTTTGLISAIAVTRGDDSFRARKLVEEQCRFLDVFEELCHRCREVHVDVERRIYSFCGPHSPST